MNFHAKAKVVCIFILFLLSSCGSQNKIDENSMDADMQAATAATETAQAEINSMLLESVSATLTAIPTSTPIAVDQMSEEDLATAVEVSTNEAVSAAEEASEYADSASADGELTQEELEELYYLYYWSIDEIEQALYLADMYYELYDELLESAILGLESIDDELQEILEVSQSILAYLDDISELIGKGEQIAQDRIGQIQDFSHSISTHIDNISTQLPEWMQSRMDEFDLIVEQALSTIPDTVAETRRGALSLAKEYIDSIKSAIGDGRFSLDELQTLSQIGANAEASLGQFGGEFTGISDMINGLTSSFARGQLPQINAGIGSLQGAIPSIR
jgi:hypothetical protein